MHLLQIADSDDSIQEDCNQELGNYSFDLNSPFDKLRTSVWTKSDTLWDWNAKIYLKQLNGGGFVCLGFLWLKPQATIVKSLRTV